MEKEVDCGLNINDSSKKSNLVTSLSKTWRTCEVEDLAPSCKISGRSGMMRNGTLSQLDPLVPFISAKGSGYWLIQGEAIESLPTPTTFDSGAPLPPRKKNNSGGQKPPLVSVMCSDRSVRLSPQFVEAMMGFPLGWTDLEDKE